MKILVCKFFKGCVFGIFVLAATLLISQPAMAVEPLSQDWQFEMDLNLWAPAIKGESATGADIDITLNDIIDNLDFTYMTTLRAKKGKWDFLLDVLYMDLEDTSDSNLIQSIPLRLDLNNIELSAWVVTPMVAYNVVHSDRMDLYLLAGARYFWLEGDLKFTKREFFKTSKFKETSSGHVWDGIVGTRGAINLAEKWYLPFYFDVGTGDSDLTWQAYSGIGYKFSNFDTTVGYRHLEWDFEDDGTFGAALNDLYITGPMIGIKYRF